MTSKRKILKLVRAGLMPIPKGWEAIFETNEATVSDAPNYTLNIPTILGEKQRDPEEAHEELLAEKAVEEFREQFPVTNEKTPLPVKKAPRKTSSKKRSTTISKKPKKK